MKRLIERVSHLSPGVVDAGLASLATFAAGLTGVNLLNDSDRGVYGVFFTAFFLGSVIMTELILVPAQVVAVGNERHKRLHQARRSLFLAIGPGLVASLAAVAAALLNRKYATTEVLIALTLTTGVTIIVSPMQDHLRQLLHIAERSWQAVVVSLVQLLGVGSAIGVLLLLDVAPAWIPFGSLATANILSVSVGAVLTRLRTEERYTEGRLTFRGLTASGKWLMTRSVIPATLAFVSANILTQLAGPEAYGFAEAARQVAQPITVLATGLMAVLGPHAIRAGSRVDSSGAAKNRRTYTLALTLVGLGYVAVAGFDWPLNPMAALVPSAYVVSGLVAATVVANWLTGLYRILVRELLGAGRARSLAVISAISAPLLPIAALTAGATEAFARPLGYIGEGSVRVLAGRYLLRKHYGRSALRGTSAEPSPDRSLIS